MNSTFCCEDCGLLHTSQHTVLDVCCPSCGAPRAMQSIVTCVGCSMPLSLDDVLGRGRGHDCRPEHLMSGVQPTVGMWVAIGTSVGRVTSLGLNTCYAKVGRYTVCASLRGNGRYVQQSTKDRPAIAQALRFVQKPDEKER